MKKLILILLLIPSLCMAADPIDWSKPYARMGVVTMGAGVAAAGATCPYGGEPDVSVIAKTHSMGISLGTYFTGQSFIPATNGINLYSIVLVLYQNTAGSTDLTFRYGSNINLGTYLKEKTLTLSTTEGNYEAVEFKLQDLTNTLSSSTTYYWALSGNATYLMASGENASVYANGTGYYTSDAAKWDMDGHQLSGEDFFFILRPCAETCVPSYTQLGGTGARGPAHHKFLTISSANINVSNLIQFIDGITNAGDFYFSANTCDGSQSLTYDFGAGHTPIITEAKFYQQDTSSHGTWKWQGSVSDGTTWVDIGDSFTLGGSTTQTITAPSANTTGYRYYRQVCLSGSTNTTPYVYEMEFKICGW